MLMPSVVAALWLMSKRTTSPSTRKAIMPPCRPNPGASPTRSEADPRSRCATAFAGRGSGPDTNTIEQGLRSSTRRKRRTMQRPPGRPLVLGGQVEGVAEGIVAHDADAHRARGGRRASGHSTKRANW